MMLQLKWAHNLCIVFMFFVIHCLWWKVCWLLIKPTCFVIDWLILSFYFISWLTKKKGYFFFFDRIKDQFFSLFFLLYLGELCLWARVKYQGCPIFREHEFPLHTLFFPQMSLVLLPSVSMTWDKACQCQEQSADVEKLLFTLEDADVFIFFQMSLVLLPTMSVTWDKSCQYQEQNADMKKLLVTRCVTLVYVHYE